MEQLLRFLLRYGGTFVFVILEVFSLVIVVNQNSFQHASFLSSSNQVAASLLNAESGVTSYFGLEKTNRQLATENTLLLNRVALLQGRQEALKDSAHGLLQIAPDQSYHYVSAKVIGNSINRLRNYITLNKGRLDGIHPEMGVINSQGVVGIVTAVSDHYASVMSVLNSRMQLSCKVKRTNDFGRLIWDGTNSQYVQLLEVPRHADVRVGDTLITSGFSAIFPEGIPVGIVTKAQKPVTSSYYDITAKLFTDFGTLTYVNVLQYQNMEELQTVQEEGQQ
ncbi:rod shape-determining protein MreC [Microbacter margulisiae]|uniref:Cell shape-determining protein MreC n=1 Tax=Microbacter margulisiae TaxID=1350067 RepID=A0A7W5DNL9_9PORP|nr:rod shape-determining protein MreC [Microbacter margulisiae]MBB3185873.1 rod shape-determining protein MreC [Microbacter margulisiae]